MAGRDRERRPRPAPGRVPDEADEHREARRHPLLDLQQSVGNREVGRLVGGSHGVQRDRDDAAPADRGHAGGTLSADELVTGAAIHSFTWGDARQGSQDGRRRNMPEDATVTMPPSPATRVLMEAAAVGRIFEKVTVELTQFVIELTDAVAAGAQVSDTGADPILSVTFNFRDVAHRPKGA